jgi:nickel/cobalt exporter
MVECLLFLYNITTMPTKNIYLNNKRASSKMKKIIIYIFAFQTILFGCATCQLMVPTAELKIDLNIEKKTVTDIHIEWHFSDLYSNEILTQYDKNKNGILDDSELKVILKAKLDYLVPKEMLTKITYAKDANNEQISKIKPKYKNFNLIAIKGILVFSYDAIVDLTVADKSMLSLVFEDDEAYFGFIITELNIAQSELYHTKNLYLFTGSLFFSYTPLEPMQDVNTTNKEEIQITPKENIQENILKKSITKIKSLFESIKDEKNPLTYMLLLFFAYIYGLIHALGPGHGKTLVASYFLSHDKSYAKALFISLSIGVVHTFSAFLLTLLVYFIVDSFLAQFLDNAVFYTTKISAFIIIFIALYLFYKKFKAYKELKKVQKKAAYTFSATPHVATCGCSSCKVENSSTDMALIISAGIIPCPGTITIFIFSLSLGLYYAGFLSALIMSLGMSTIIFLSALLSVALRKKTSNGNGNIKKYLEYASLSIILVLGILLLFT